MSLETQAAIDEMRAEVQRSTTVVVSVKALIAKFVDAVEDAADDPEEIRALTAEMRANTDSLAADVEANTDQPAPPVEPPAEPEA